MLIFSPNYPNCGMNTYPDRDQSICPDGSNECLALAFNDDASDIRIYKDAHGNVLNDGDTVTALKDLKGKGSSLVIKGGTKLKNIRLVDVDHDIDCKVDGQSMLLKSKFMKK